MHTFLTVYAVYFVIGNLMVLLSKALKCSNSSKTQLELSSELS